MSLRERRRIITMGGRIEGLMRKRRRRRKTRMMIMNKINIESHKKNT